MIPKVIHYCWFGTDELSDLAKKCINSWKKKCPDYTIRLWNEKDFDMNLYPYMKEAYEEKAWGFVPDVARLIIIYNEGGIYLDTDVEIIKSLDPLLDNKAFFGFESSSFVNLGEGFGAESHSEVILEMLKEYEHHHYRNERGEIDRTPSPYIQTETLKRLGLNVGNYYQTVCGASVYPTDYFCPISFDTGECIITENTYSIHHFDGSWLDDYQKEMLKVKREIFAKHRGSYGKLLWQFKRVSSRIRKDGVVGSIRLVKRKLEKLYEK